MNGKVIGNYSQNIAISQFIFSQKEAERMPQLFRSLVFLTSVKNAVCTHRHPKCSVDYCRRYELNSINSTVFEQYNGSTRLIYNSAMRNFARFLSPNFLLHSFPIWLHYRAEDGLHSAVHLQPPLIYTILRKIPFVSQKDLHKRRIQIFRRNGLSKTFLKTKRGISSVDNKKLSILRLIEVFWYNATASDSTGGFTVKY